MPQIGGALLYESGRFIASRIHFHSESALHLSSAHPLHLRYPNSFQAWQQRCHVPLTFMPEDFGGRHGKRCDIMIRVVVDSEVERVARMINHRLGVLAVSLRAEEVELARL